MIFVGVGSGVGLYAMVWLSFCERLKILILYYSILSADTFGEQSQGLMFAGGALMCQKSETSRERYFLSMGKFKIIGRSSPRRNFVRGLISCPPGNQQSAVMCKCQSLYGKQRTRFL